MRCRRAAAGAEIRWPALLPGGAGVRGCLEVLGSGGRRRALLLLVPAANEGGRTLAI
jgi:hypothetical protein